MLVLRGSVRAETSSHSGKEEKLLSRFEKVLLQGGFTPQAVRLFRKIIYNRYLGNPRSLPWRESRDPYRILVSEIMLQQTQAERVIGKYETFLMRFPDFPSLAGGSLREILRAWQGLGYNRRAIALQGIARMVMSQFQGRLPCAEEDLIKLPGVGKYTASAVSVFAFGQSALFVETNIRRVYIHFFFRDRDNVRDAEIMPLIEKTIDASNPREWYYALMDYGVMLKKMVLNPNRRSAHYQRPAPFKGSDRELRGRILKSLIAKPAITEREIIREFGETPERVRAIVSQLRAEGFLKRRGTKVALQ